MALMVLKHLGMDPKVATLLQDVWGNQRCLLQYRGETLDEGMTVTASLPQGDNSSTLALTGLLIPAFRAINTEHAGTTQVVSADDRSIQLQDHFGDQWAAPIGLKENQQKAQLFSSSTSRSRAVLS